MTVGKFLQALVVVVALGASATASGAEDYSVFFMGTVSSLFDKGYYNEYTTPYGSSYKTGGGFTLGAEVPLGKILGVEGSYSNVRNNLAITDFGLSTPVESGYGIHDQRLSGDLVAHAPRSFLGLKPYLAAGLEYDRFSPVGPSSDIFSGFVNAPFGAANKVGINYGGGVDMKLLPYVNSADRCARPLDEHAHLWPPFVVEHWPLLPCFRQPLMTWNIPPELSLHLGK